MSFLASFLIHVSVRRDDGDDVHKEFPNNSVHVAIVTKCGSHTKGRLLAAARLNNQVVKRADVGNIGLSIGEGGRRGGKE